MDVDSGAGESSQRRIAKAFIDRCPVHDDSLCYLDGLSMESRSY